MAKYDKSDAFKVWENCFSTRADQIDPFGKKIKFGEYGQDSEFGWEVDHIWPLNPEGSNPKGADTLSNLQPLHFQSNNAKANKLNGKAMGKKFEVRKISSNKEKNIGRLIVNGKQKYNYNRWQ